MIPEGGGGIGWRETHGGQGLVVEVVPGGGGGKKSTMLN